MIQNIEPHIYNNTYLTKEQKNTDHVFVFQSGKILLVKKEQNWTVPTRQDIGALKQFEKQETIYLFSIDDQAIFLLKDFAGKTYINNDFTNMKENEISDETTFAYHALSVLRNFTPKWLGFAGITANHLYNWYRSNQFCGCCGTPMDLSTTERAVRCPNCGFTDYPKICPAIIVGVIHEDKILMTKYANRSFKKYALIAGFCEIGETLEDTVRREIMEEVGLKVKNIRYYNNQPWGFSSSLLIGFFADLDGDNQIALDTNELAEAEWFNREDIPEDEENKLSLTYTMMMAFKNQQI
ncbi:NAD(+) diphosphatase [Anaerosporobacter faecicola]|uniref:NAD(+) diphosphatase n=1 Tax=Anaerosporobacter faecicola TaxID=2718714 RepID=UPI001439DDE2|nr:NAD(+) diphosphatase [Anaerosporobacter faecicola]